MISTFLAAAAPRTRSWKVPAKFTIALRSSRRRGLYEKPLPVNAIFTVEPGVYLPEQGFGVRIEDEVIEAWVSKARQTH